MSDSPHDGLIEEARGWLNGEWKVVQGCPCDLCVACVLITKLADALESLSSLSARDTERLNWIQDSFLGHALAMQDNGDVDLRKSLDAMMASDAESPVSGLSHQERKE